MNSKMSHTITSLLNPPYPFKTAETNFALPKFLYSATADTSYDFEYAQFYVFSKQTGDLLFTVNTDDRELTQEQCWIAWEHLWGYYNSDAFCVLKQIHPNNALYQVVDGKPMLILESVHKEHNHFKK